MTLMTTTKITMMAGFKAAVVMIMATLRAVLLRFLNIFLSDRSFILSMYVLHESFKNPTHQ